MSAPFYVYGLRVKEDREVRYVGETNSLPEFRLYGHYANARCDREYLHSALTDWLLENEGNVEAFKIGAADTREEARGLEKAVIALCLRLNQRLFNRTGVPRDLHIVRSAAA